MKDQKFIEQEVIEILKTIFDPEIPVNIYELGLIYKIEITPSFNAIVEMTLTSPACPVAESLPGEVKQRIKGIYGINEVFVELVWEPTWNMDMMSEEAKLQLGML
ncbi:MAG: SUF system Fe-S cluster assembly protein [Bacteroidetes bacterium]|nr:SUF system Fe-S cluster assembly protein [Bacteroidota bacterium]MBU1114318.1 SUF system Fe-S cluster assembly protein [Bacteroidota bacterium]MBU1797096.1 SUF system Fe-S cluster assembly protein [Bacteroidota bacterium]PIQ09817.1 MAG: FeS assembly SUF system protein [Ignavibacteriales bacterium CG18_big_fil_WC_8_21_14_2_50_31_20]